LIRYLVDSSALWRLIRDDVLRSSWSQAINAGAVGSCHPQRAEFRRSARDVDEYEQMTGMFDDLYPDVSVPKGAWTWIESSQYRLVRSGTHRAVSTIDLLICATAAQHGLIVLHDDNDFAAVARHLPDVSEHRVRDMPAGQEA
jgi:predicted nucleic acid-binding protein